MESNAKTPQIRFKEFTDAWEQRKLDNAFDFLQNNTLSRADLNPETGAAKNVHYGDVLIKYGEYLDASTADLPYIPEQQVVDKFRNSFLQDGDIVMADTAEDETVGKCLEISNLQDFPAISGSHTIPMRPRQKFASGYLGYYMNSGAYHDQLLPLMQGIKVTSVSKNAIKETVISFPIETEEQKAIGQYFIQLDNLITLYQRKYDKLVTLKLSMLEKLFPKDGSDVPEVRFDGFTDAWEQYKLGDLGVFSSNGVDKLSKPNEIPVNLLNYMDVYNRRTITSKNCHELMQVTAKPTQLINNDVRTNDIFFTPTSETADDIGHVMVIEESLENTVYSYHLMRFRPQEGVFYKTFPNYCFDTESVRSQMSLMAQGVQRFVLSKSQFENIVVLLPKIEEQIEIATFFTNLDNLITVHQHRLEKLKNIKKSMLQKMFI